MIPSTVKSLLYEIAQYRRGYPTAASLGITERCRLRCKMCRFWLDGHHDEEAELKTAEWATMIDELIGDLDVKRIRLIGGEPFVREDAVDLIRHAKSRGAHVSVVTDGTCVDARLADEIVTAGLDRIRFSIDGVRSTHDRIRGQRGAYELVTSAVRYIQEARRRHRGDRPEVQIYFLVSRFNVHQLLELHRESQTSLGPSQFLFGMVWESTEALIEGSVWRGRRLTNTHHLPIGKSLQLDAAGRRELRDQLRRLPANMRGKLCEKLLPQVARLLPRRKICPEANHFHVDPFGRVMICSLYMTFFFGKYPEQSIRDIWLNSTHLSFQRDVHRQFLPMCNAVCGSSSYYVGNPRQHARSLIARSISSPFRRDARARGADCDRGRGGAEGRVSVEGLPVDDELQGTVGVSRPQDQRVGGERGA